MDTQDKKKNPKIMPNNIEAEQSLLGAILIDENVGLECISELQQTDFYYQAHREIYECMRALQSSGKPIDVITLSDKLIKEGKLDSVGGMSYLTELTNVLPSSANYRYYFDIVKRNGMLRKIISAGKDIIEHAYESDDAGMALAYAEKKVFEMSDSEESSDLVHVNDTVNDVLKKYEEILTNPDSNLGQLTYFKNLDNITHGYKGGQMIVIAARPGVGKTSFAMNIVCNIAKNEPNKVVAIFNLEMSISELTQRILLTMASVPQQNVLSGASADEFKRLWQAKKVLEESNLYIDDTANTTAEQIMSKCRRLKQIKGRLDLVVIDYLQLLKSHTARQSIQQEVTEISRAIKIMAKELNVPVIALSQTSRDLEKRDDASPKLSDLRESGAIEQDADQVYFLVKNKAQEGQDIEVIDLAIIKHRSGECKTISFKWEGSMVKFTPVTFEEAKYIKQSAAAGVVKEAIGSNADSKENNAAPTVTGAVVYGAEEVAVSVDENIPVEDIDSITPPPAADDWAAELSAVAESVGLIDTDIKIDGIEE